MARKAVSGLRYGALRLILGVYNGSLISSTMVKIFWIVFFLMASFSLMNGATMPQVTDSGRHFGVGYQTLVISDAGRPYSVKSSLPRVLPVHIWYPARDSRKAKMKFLNYVEAEKNVTWGQNSSQSMLKSWVKQFTDSANVDRISASMANISTAAVLRAAPIAGKHPVVVLGNGLTTPGCFYSSIAEYLSGSGYVVVGYPALPENESRNFAFSERGILNQVRDLEWVIDAISKLSYVDNEKIALASWSVGDASQIIFQMKHRVAKAIISMDGASQYEYGQGLIVRSLYYDSDDFSVPVLSLKASRTGKFMVPRSTFFYDSLAKIKMQFAFSNLSHSDILSFAQYVKYFETGELKEKDAHKLMCDIVRKYLDGKLLDNISAIRQLETLPRIVEE